MGTSTSVQQFSGKINRAANAIKFNEERAVKAGSLVAKDLFISTAPMSRGSRIAGARWGARFDVVGAIHPTALVRYTGPVHLVHNPTKPHWVISRRAGGSKASRGQGRFRSRGRQGVRTPQGVRYYARHPGTTGKRWFPTTKATARRAVPPVVHKALIVGPLKGIF